MLIMILGLVLLLGTHVLTTFRTTRAELIERYGLKAYRAAYSLASLAGLALIVWGFGRYRAEGWVQLWTPPAWGRHLAMLLVWFAFVALATAHAKASRIKGWLRHPMVIGVTAWALAHLLANGDLGGLVLFGSFLAWAIYDRVAVAARGDAGAPQLADFARGDAIALGAGTALYALILVLHPTLFGVSVLR